MVIQKTFALRIVIFLLGLVVVFGASIAGWPRLVANGNAPAAYFIVCVCLVYLAAFLCICSMVEKSKKKEKNEKSFLISNKVIFLAIVICLAQSILVVSGAVSIAVGLIILSVLVIPFFVIYIIKTRIGRKEKKNLPTENQGLGLITQIRSSMDVLVLKTVALPEKNNSEKEKIKDLDQAVNLMNPVGTIDAAKLEQEILMNVTQISSLCDSVIAGSDDANFKKMLAVIENQIRERKLKNID